ncbi:MAG: histidinol-phosphatase HisJ family protein [Puniceicoccaceae bacterium]|nr:MAG: histidinol-phosphatase HisJ family protein [Puniceicoccaceae bacterium]
MHTPLCGHAVGLPIEYARAAAERGIKLITVTCHVPMEWGPFGQAGIRMQMDELPGYFDLVRQTAAEASQFGVEVRVGIEAEVFPDEARLERMDAILSSEPFDFVIGSLHHQCQSYQLWLEENGVEDDEAIIDTYFKHLTAGVRSGRYDTIGHPDVIRIYGTVAQFDPARHEDRIKAYLKATVEADCCMEVNTSGLSKGVYIVHPDPLILDWAQALGVRLTIGSDSHRPESVGQHFDTVLPMLRTKGFHEVHYFRERQRFSAKIPVPEGQATESTA